MENLKNASIAVVVSVVVVVLGFTLLNKPTEQAIPPQQLGAVPGNSIEGKYFTVGGVERAYVRMEVIATSSVPCVTKNPFSASSTLVQWTAHFSDTPTDQAAYNQDMDFATSTNAYLNATSSQSIINDIPLASDKQKSVTWYNTNTGQSPKYLMRATDYVGMKMATNTPGVDLFTGVCTAIFQKL